MKQRTKRRKVFVRFDDAMVTVSFSDSERKDLERLASHHSRPLSTFIRELGLFLADVPGFRGLDRVGRVAKQCGMTPGQWLRQMSLAAIGRNPTTRHLIQARRWVDSGCPSPV